MVLQAATRKRDPFRALDDQVRFLRSWIGDPLKTGAVAPSGKLLARALAAAVDPAIPGPVVELGPGTGVVTEALIERGIDPARLIAIEYNPDFVTLLRARFPKATILQGDAYDIGTVVQRHTGEKIAAVVSSLPLFTQPPPRRIAMVEASFDLMHPGGPFVQFSYALVSPVPRTIPRMTVHISDWIMRNVPPARVWTYRRQALSDLAHIRASDEKALKSRAIAVFDTEKRAKIWMKTPNPLLAGQTPLEHVETPDGAHRVEALLDRIAAGDVA
jgi:phosphatidylethanolamine/phosphatidyl-N-methylethanolamine N-methyltransferase